jgi:flagellar basal-body rod modification protein FlgD
MAVQSTISEIQSAGTAAQDAAKTKSKDTLGKDEFLKLLTAQLQQQDPTQPMDNTEFVAQLAQFSSLEQMSNANDTLTKLLTGQTTSLQTGSADLVGKTAMLSGDEITLEEGDTSAKIGLNLDKAAAGATVDILAADGTTVRELEQGEMSAGANTITWDGKDSNGDAVSPGQYTARVVVVGTDGQDVTFTQTSSARITGMTFKDSTPTYIAGGKTLQLSDISEVDE